MKKGVLIALLMIAFISCKKGKKAIENEPKTEKEVVVKNTKEKNILDVEYLNDTLDIAIDNFKIIQLKDDRYELEISMATTKIEKYSKDHKFFVQCYYHDDTEVDKSNKLSVGTNKVRVDGNNILYSRKFTSKVDIFKTIRYGLVNSKTKERYFTLKIDSITLVN